MKKNALITGGLGLLGKPLVKFLKLSLFNGSLGPLSLLIL